MLYINEYTQDAMWSSSRWLPIGLDIYPWVCAYVHNEIHSCHISQSGPANDDALGDQGVGQPLCIAPARLISCLIPRGVWTQFL